MNINKLNVLIWDLGLQAELAVTLANKCASVKYYVPANMEIYPTPLKSFIGRGLEGVERVKAFFPHVDQADAIIIPESQLGEVVSFLKKRSLPVAGPGLEHTWLETERWEARTTQNDLGLPTQMTYSLQGIDELRQFFDTHKGFMVKGNGFRGLFDTFKVRDKKDLEPEINRLKFHLGPFCDDLPFMAEECVEGLETGYDTISWDQKEIWPGLLSLAAKDECYLCKTCAEAEMPVGYKLMHDLLAKKLAGYRFFYSVETITGKDQVPYLIDLTLRIGSPSPLSIYLELYSNFAEVICGMATGEQVDPMPTHRYAASVNLTLKNEDNFSNIEIPAEIRQHVKLVKGCKKGTEFYTCPEWEVAATVVACGDSAKSVMQLAKDRCAEVKGRCLVDNSQSLDLYAEDIEKARKIGINF